MALRVCEYCGKPFNSLGAGVCAACSVLLDEDYAKVKKYIYRNPQSARFADIVENTDVSEKALNYLIKQGRVEVRDKPSGGPKCKVCGREVQEGFLCDRCREVLQSEKLFSGVVVPEENVQKNKNGVIPLAFKNNED